MRGRGIGLGLGCFRWLDTGHAGTIGPSTGGNLELDVIVVVEQQKESPWRKRAWRCRRYGSWTHPPPPPRTPLLLITGRVGKGSEAVGISSDILGGVSALSSRRRSAVPSRSMRVGFWLAITWAM